MDGYLDLTAEEVAAAADAVGVTLPWQLMAMDVSAEVIADLARLGRRHLIARGLVTHDDAGYHIDTGLADAVAVMGDPFVISVIVEVTRHDRSGSWVFVGATSATVVSGLGDGVVRLRSVPVDALPAAIARVAGLDGDLVAADVGEVRIDLRAMSEAAEALVRDPTSDPFEQPEHPELSGLAAAAEVIGADGRVHAVVTLYPTPEGQPVSSTTFWLETEGAVAALEFDDERTWLTAVPATTRDLLDSIRAGYPSSPTPDAPLTSTQ